MANRTSGRKVEPTTVAYSAGGVWPCIVGTAPARHRFDDCRAAHGICSAIYLSEYSRNTALFA